MGFNKGDQSEARDERGNTAQDRSIGRWRVQKLGCRMAHLWATRMISS